MPDLVSIHEDHRAIIIVEWDRRETANNSAAAWDPDTGGDETFGTVKLSSDGTDPPSHTACHTALTDAMRSDGWDFESALEDRGLQVIEEETI